MSTPELHLHTLFVLNSDGRILSNREPGANRGPLFSLIRGAANNAWAVRADVPEDVASEIDDLAQREPLAAGLREPPLHADRYLALLSEVHPLPGGSLVQYFGPAFEFPEAIERPADIVMVEDERLLQPGFPGWAAGDLHAGRSPVMAMLVDGSPVSICYCARSSEAAAEAGVETAAAFRGRGFAPLVTAAWASAIRASGRIPLYSAAWTNDSSLAVARKLGLRTYASGWSVSAGAHATPAPA